MDINEIKTFFETNKDNEDVKNYLSELSKVTVEGVEKFISTEEGKKWLSKQNDSFFSKGLETWKKNNLEKLINDEVAKRNTETPEQKQIRELTERLNKKEAEEKRQMLINKGLLKMDEKKLPKELIEFFVSNDTENGEQITYKNLETLEKVFNTHIEAAVKARLGEGYKPPTGNGSGADSLQEQIRKSINNY